MVYYLYIDVLFLVNFVMDTLLLLILRKVLKANATAFRIFLSAMLGALWAVFLTVNPTMPRILESILTYTLISSLMVGIAFRIRDIRGLLQALLGLYLSAVTMGGTIYALYQHTRVGYYIEQLIRGRIAEAMPVYIWVLLIVGAYFAVRYLGCYMRNISRQKSNLYEVTLYYKEHVVSVVGLMDTGNHLYEPISHKPVHIITYQACNKLYSQIPLALYIPFHSVGKSEGVLPCVYLDRMELLLQGGGIQIVEKPLLAVCREALSSSGEYEMLLHEES